MTDAGEAPRRRSVGGAVLRALGLVTAVAFVALLVYGLAARSPDTTIDDGLARGEPTDAPGFELDVLQAGQPLGRVTEAVRRATADKRVSLSELRGTPVVLNMWASWCQPCREEAPALERGWRDATRVGVVFLGLDMQDAPEDARTFLRDFGVTYPVVRDPGKETFRAYGATGCRKPSSSAAAARSSLTSSER